MLWPILALVVLWLIACACAARELAVDDTFTGLVYIKNLLAGHGLTFTEGQKPVEGVTNIAWLFLLTPFASLAEPLVAAKLIGLLAVIAACVLTVRFASGRANRSEIEPFGLAIVPVALLAVSFEFVYFPLAGMETGLLALLLMLMVSRAVDRSLSYALPCLGTFAFLTHPEAVLVYPAYLVLSEAAKPTSRHRRIVGLAVYAVLLLMVTAVRWFYFDDVLPNTFHAKPSGLAGMVEGFCRFLGGQNTNVAFPITGWLSLPVLVLGYLRIRRSTASGAAMMAAICATGLLFAVYSPADWTNLPRYFAPYLPAALILLWAGVVEFVQRLVGNASLPEDVNRGRNARIVLTVIAVLLFGTTAISMRIKLHQLGGFPGYVIAGKGLIAPALWMREHLPQEATIATRRIGALAYFTSRPVFDYAYGLPDRDVAKLVAENGGRFDSPTAPALKTVWQLRQPDYLLEDEPIMEYIIAHAGGSRQRFAIHGIEYRVIRDFPLGDEARWVLAERLKP